MTYSIDKIFPPYLEEGMLKIVGRNTICDTLRRVYRDIDANNLEDAKYKIRVAVTMAKRMSTKLKSYDKEYHKTFFPKKSKKEKE